MNYDYNTSRTKLILPEYGRNLHKMVEFATKIEDKEERNRAAKAIISIMGNLNPHLRDIADFKHKLWDHLLIMSDFTIDIDSPYPIPPKEKFSEKPRTVPYNNYRIKYKHYGKSIEFMIKEAVKMEEGEEKEVLIKMLANHMKKSYLTWNRESVSDEMIISDLKELSGGKLVVSEDLKLNETREILSKSNTSSPTQKKKRNIRKTPN